MELYIHIPFCIRKCAYCDFLSAPADEDTREAYMDSLEKQLISQAASFGERTIDTVFIGGGTPTVLSEKQLERLLRLVNEKFTLIKDVEFTVEANPGTVNAEKAGLLVTHGVNRVSLGLQSADNRELQLLGRIHTYEEFLQSFGILRSAGIRNINVDLMSALPGQTIDSYRKTLRQVLALRPEHISAYSLIIEEGTPFYEQYREDECIRERGETPQLLPSEEAERQMYELTGELLSRYGYERYEISNYAKAGRSCRHNIGYWIGEEYLGLGLGAASYIEGTRYSNTADIVSYIKGDHMPHDRQKLSTNDRMAEYFYLGLRMTQGVSKAEFVRRFGSRPDQVYGNLFEELIEQGLLTDTGRNYHLTDYGRDVSNQVLYRFLL